MPKNQRWYLIVIRSTGITNTWEIEIMLEKYMANTLFAWERDRKRERERSQGHLSTQTHPSISQKCDLMRWANEATERRTLAQSELDFWLLPWLWLEWLQLENYELLWWLSAFSAKNSMVIINSVCERANPMAKRSHTNAKRMYLYI